MPDFFPNIHENHSWKIIFNFSKFILNWSHGLDFYSRYSHKNTFNHIIWLLKICITMTTDLTYAPKKANIKIKMCNNDGNINKWFVTPTTNKVRQKQRAKM